MRYWAFVNLFLRLFAFSPLPVRGFEVAYDAAKAGLSHERSCH
jgi:hypothetical protein